MGFSVTLYSVLIFSDLCLMHKLATFDFSQKLQAVTWNFSVYYGTAPAATVVSLFWGEVGQYRHSANTVVVQRQWVP